jgi:hypothetical protein
MVSPDGFFPERNCVQQQHASGAILHRFGSARPPASNPPPIQSGEESLHAERNRLTIGVVRA